ncbi:MAG: S1 RNA-binding domain-containing protein [Cyanobacteria bacterium]|nr:S1 RNA-binding domain-containing protein [Cyanobacteriota bacterium]
MSDQEEDFATMFEASVKARQFKRGEPVEGTIVAIGPKVALVNIGGKGEAELDVAELKDHEGDIEVSVGDRISAMVVSTTRGIVLSRKGVRNAATQRELEDAYRSGMAVEGKVVQEVKGGYEVRIARGPSTGSGSPRAESRGERAFCPLSQIDIVRTTDTAVHVGKTYAFNVIEYKNGGKDVVVSRRKQLEAEQAMHAAEARKAIVAGAAITGRVVSVPNFGAFVDLGGGIQGLLHVSEMSWTRVSNPNEVVAPGDQVTVRVLRVDEATGKISLGLKQLQEDPWTTAASKFPLGQVRTGKVARIADFGVFVELDPGFTGLLPSPETGVDRGGDLRKAFPIGSDVEVVVLEVDQDARRIRLSKKAVAEQREQAELREYTERQDATPAQSVGSMADKLRDALKGR